MDSVLRALVIYLFLLVLLRPSGKRTLAQVTTFDFILLLIIGEATQQALLGNDFSLTNAGVVITTIVALDVGESVLGRRFNGLSRLLNGTPLVIFENGRPIEKRMKKIRVEVSDIMETARRAHGLERLDQIKYAVLERSGGISVIPK